MIDLAMKMCLNYFVRPGVTSGRHREYSKNWLFYLIFLLNMEWTFHYIFLPMSSIQCLINKKSTSVEISQISQISQVAFFFYKFCFRQISKTVNDQDTIFLLMIYIWLKMCLMGFILSPVNSGPHRMGSNKWSFLISLNVFLYLVIQSEKQ